MRSNTFPVAPPRLRETTAVWLDLFERVELRTSDGCDESQAWQRLRSQLKNEQTGALSRLMWHHRVSWVAAFATGCLLFWVGWSFVHPSLPRVAKVQHTEEQPPSTNVTPLHLDPGVSQLPDGSQVTLTERTRADFQAGKERSTLSFETGSVTVAVAHQPEGHTFAVRTGAYAFVALGTHFTVRALDERIELQVDEGRVAIEYEQRRLTVIGANGNWSSVAEPVPSPSVSPSRPVALPAKLAPVAVEPATCRELIKTSGPKAAEECYLGQSIGAGLSAEMALFEAARIQRDVLSNPIAAVDTLEQFEKRFPSGSLIREVRMAKVHLLARLGRVEEALSASEGILAAGTGVAATVELHLLRGNLLRTRRGAYAAAESEYRLIEHDPGARGDQAQLARADCLERLGRTDEAIAVYRSYLTRINPQQAAQAQKRLQSLTL